MFWTAAQQVATQALENGSLLPIATEATVVQQDGVRFLLHIKSANAGKKPIPGKSRDDPFLPYEQEMFVGPAGSSHVCLLNKFPVLVPHLLICTETFVSQTQPLTLSDFEAWLLGFDAPQILGFYNSGTPAGASQAHRHMQLVQTHVPLEEKILSGNLDFSHWLLRFETLNAQELLHAYQDGMHQLGLMGESECRAYNLLLTDTWMLLVPRITHQLNRVFANGLNYSGRFLVNNHEQGKRLEEYGLLRFLGECSQGSAGAS